MHVDEIIESVYLHLFEISFFFYLGLKKNHFNAIF